MNRISDPTEEENQSFQLSHLETTRRDVQLITVCGEQEETFL